MRGVEFHFSMLRIIHYTHMKFYPLSLLARTLLHHQYIRYTHFVVLLVTTSSTIYVESYAMYLYAHIISFTIPILTKHFHIKYIYTNLSCAVA